MTKPEEISSILADIARISGDGFHFVNLRFSAERWAEEAAEGNEASAYLVELIQRFHLLLKHIEKSGGGL